MYCDISHFLCPSCNDTYYELRGCIQDPMLHLEKHWNVLRNLLEKTFDLKILATNYFRKKVPSYISERIYNTYLKLAIIFEGNCCLNIWKISVPEKLKSQELWNSMELWFFSPHPYTMLKSRHLCGIIHKRGL